MAPIAAIPAVGAPVEAALSAQSRPPATGSGFGNLLEAGLQQVDAKVAHADALIQAYAEGATIPLHQVTLALEEARLAVELAVQVRSRLVETYRDFMNMPI